MPAAHASAAPHARYDRRFRNLHRRAVEAVDDALPALWGLDRPDALDRLQALADDLSAVYDLPSPEVRYADRPYYAPGEAVLAVDKPSIVSFLHEYRHHMQAHGRQANDNIEEDARGWSISLFATAEPRHFRRAWERGSILFLPPFDG